MWRRSAQSNRESNSAEVSTIKRPDPRILEESGDLNDQLMSEINITTNKNTVPFDPESPFVTSGLRLGSPAMTTRGLGTTEFTEIANIIADRLLNP